MASYLFLCTLGPVQDFIAAARRSRDLWAGSKLLSELSRTAAQALVHDCKGELIFPAMVAEIHGRCGYFPPILNIRPLAGAVPPQYELGELVDLNQIRQIARARRSMEG